MIGSTLSYDALGSLVLFVNGERAPDREEWKTYVAFLKERAAEHATVRLVVVSGSAGPDSVQRQQLADSVSAKQLRTAVVSDSVVARGVVTAFRWYGLDVSAFKSSAIDEAYAYVGATPDEVAWLRLGLAAARADVGPRAASR